ncbi:uncharacterized protein TNCV_4444421 [Trichonephila clavipes]|nr:uncharacterized protein TNCV_4444421 [Trichonephila clavipes]
MLLAAIQGLWFQHEMGPRCIFVLLHVIGWMSQTPAVVGRQSPVLWPPRLLDLTPLDFFLMGLSQGTGVSGRSDNTNGLSCSYACCLYFGGPHGTAMCDDSHSTVCSSLPRHARRTL